VELLRKGRLESLRKEDPEGYELAMEFQRRLEERIASLPWWKRWIYRMFEDIRG